jgi:hypothetical protein
MPLQSSFLDAAVAAAGVIRRSPLKLGKAFTASGQRAFWKLAWRSSRMAQRDETEPSLERPISQACTYKQFVSPIYSMWCQQFGETPRLHRKQWEFCYILQALAVHGMLGPRQRGLGYGVGTEPLPAVMAARGCAVVVTDCDYEQAKAAGWVTTDQHAIGAVNDRGICDDAFCSARALSGRRHERNSVRPLGV